MVVFINGRFVAEEAAVVSVFDRGLLGDGIFETLRVVRGLPFQWDEHMARLTRGAEMLGILPPLTAGEMRLAAARLVALNGMINAVLRITLTRGPGPRGYSPRDAVSPSLVMTVHPAPKSHTGKHPHIRLITASVRIAAGDPLANVKTCSKLPHILARAEADVAGADDALLLNTRGEIAEASSSNIFWLERDTLCTPPLSSGALDGITRATVLVLGKSMGLSVRERNARPHALRVASGVFLTGSVRGLIDVTTLDETKLKLSRLVEKLRQSYLELLKTP